MKMQTEINVPPDFQATLDENEKLLWADKPIFVPYILTNIWHNILFLIFAIYFILTMWGSQHNSNSGNSNMFIYLFPCFFLLFGLYGTLSALFSYSNTIYAFSARRVIIRTGFIGIDYQTIDYDKIADTEVSVNMFEKMYGVGSIKFSTGARDPKGNLLYQQFTSVKNPYEIFKQLKEVTVDVKTDYNYPNALRPEKNTGYKSEYDPE